jgi:hypothetical protein
MDVLHRQKGRACILIGAGAAPYCNGILSLSRVRALCLPALTSPEAGMITGLPLVGSPSFPDLYLLHRAKSFRWRSLYRTALAPGLPRNIGGVLRGLICIKARGPRFLCRRTGPSSRRTRDSGTGIRPGRLYRLGILWVRIGRLRNRNGWEHSDHKRDDKFWHSHLHSYSSSCRDHAALP